MKKHLAITVLCALVVSCGGGGGGGGSSNSSSTTSNSQPSATLLQAPSFWQTYSGTTNAVVPNVALPAGLYKISVITSRYAILKEITTDTPSLLNVSTGEADVGAEALFQSTGGNYTFQLSNIGAAWTMAIQNIDFGNPKDISEIGNTQEYGPKVMGPFRVTPLKTYLFTMNCNSYFIMIPYSPYTGERDYSVFNESRGNNGAQSTGKFTEDLVLFQTYNMDETSWSVTAQPL